MLDIALDAIRYMPFSTIDGDGANVAPDALPTFEVTSNTGGTPLETGNCVQDGANVGCFLLPLAPTAAKGNEVGSYYNAFALATVDGNSNRVLEVVFRVIAADATPQPTLEQIAAADAGGPPHSTPITLTVVDQNGDPVRAYPVSIMAATRETG